jgi:hypothetical protein
VDVGEIRSDFGSLYTTVGQARLKRSFYTFQKWKLSIPYFKEDVNKFVF